jgi:diacylglycerol kinase
LIDNDVNLPVKKFVKGFVFAFNGIRAMLRERNFLVELGMLLVTILLGIYFKIDRQDWINIFSVSGLVLGLEVINTSIERLCNLYSMEENAHIKTIKDISAGAVLIACVFAAIVGILIFLPYLLNQ